MLAGILESAVERAVLAVQLDPAYTEEVWRVSADDLAGTSHLAGASQGQVAIRVAPVNDSDSLLVIDAVATYPYRSEYAVKARKRVAISITRDAER